MKFLTATFLIVAILFMFVFMFIGIWLFIVAIKSHKQLRYQNYILEKICQKLNALSNKMYFNESIKDNPNYSTDDFDLNQTTEDSDYDDISSFDKSEELK
ncbi:MULTISPECIES: hypothetical protein [Clostridium]|uniref:Uncharacterized protein n=1 Tax=Clostridium aquiflavi TaxID=3073603 RepID=A0ABU1ED28_9CLOT|nr:MULTISPECIES: hypothetical protein [unclassified Clostridium]MDR5586291.1 hypothetical protein [Clostridium sp. 5N-1]NFG62385.1 hypothetical protein [Clostridium botulinum]NFQ10254.1 hypothetical protein [Clostridium botulinum]